MKASLSRWLAMKGWRLPIQMRRRSPTSLRVTLKRLQVFFMRQPETAQNPPDGAAMDGDAVGLGQFADQLINRDLALGGDARLDPAGHPGQLAMPAAIALRPWRERSGVASQFDQFVHEFRRDPEMPRRLPASVTLINKHDNTRSKLYRMWLAHMCAPYLPQSTESHRDQSGNLNLKRSDMLERPMMRQKSFMNRCSKRSASAPVKNGWRPRRTLRIQSMKVLCQNSPLSLSWRSIATVGPSY